MRNAKLWLLSLLLISCGSDRSEFGDTKGGGKVSNDNFTIIGGTTDTGDPAVVGIYAQVPGANEGALCTGTLISQTVVLTAAHCCSPAMVGEGAVHHVYLGPDITQSKNHPELWASVKKVDWDQDFNQSAVQSGHDIGVVVLDKPVSIEPIPFNRKPLSQDMVGQPVRLVGYGLDKGFQQTGAGVKRQTTSNLDSFDDLLLSYGKDGHKTCSGDSGGPGFMKIDGVETLVGITSFGMIYCLGQGNDTRVDKYLSFIDQYLGSCTPSCSGRTCGSDGCNGSCGTCLAGQTCTLQGQCMNCAPVCTGKTCGPDGCGGNCGSCGAGNECNSSGQCVPVCQPNCQFAQCGDDGCSGSCGTCAANQVCLFGFCL